HTSLKDCGATSTVVVATVAVFILLVSTAMLRAAKHHHSIGGRCPLAARGRHHTQLPRFTSYHRAMSFE
ncbi:MAG: hypothetical protein ABIS45_15210, partial [Burkholderiales bacterium]